MNERRAVGVSLIVVTPFLLAMSIVLNAKLIDSFHEGEYLGNIWYILDYYQGLVSFPVLVHGAMDFLPSVLARAIFGDEHLIIYTRLINTVLVFMAWVLYLDMGRRLIGRYSLLLFGLFTLSFLWMAASSGNNPLGLQQAFIGVRDLFLIASIYSTIRALDADLECNKKLYFSWLSVSSSAAAVSLYWSYDRGIMAFCFIAAFSFLLLLRKKVGSFILVVLSYTITLIAIQLTYLVGTLGQTVRNILYWIQYSDDVWYMAFELKQPALSWAVGLVCFFVMSGIVALVRLLVKTTHNNHYGPVVFGLIAVQFLFFFKLYKLPTPDSFYFIWPSVLIFSWALGPLVRCFGPAGSIDLAIFNVKNIFESYIFPYTVALLVVCFLNGSLWYEVIKFEKVIENIDTVLRPNLDRALVDEGRFNLGILEEVGHGCIFQFSNEGIYSFFAKRRFCTSFGYGVYVSQEYESQVLSELANNPPLLVVFKSNNWYWYIYDRSMKDRLPLIHEFIKQNYTFRKSESGYEFAILGSD